MASLPASSLSLPAAARLQRDVEPVDIRLFASARLMHPTIVWWWGARRDARGTGAYCYLCGEWVARWSGRNAMTEQARSAVLGHRDTHERGSI